MNSLISNRFICFSCLHFPAPNILFHRQNPNLIICYQKRWLPKTSIFCSTADYNLTNSARYGGWDDNGLVSDSDQFRNFLVSVGIDHKRHLFIFLFGFLCALAISRVKVSSIAVFPASVFVFAVGFSLGFVRGGSIDELNLLGNKNRGKEEISGYHAENLRNLEKFFDGFAVKLDNLKCSIQNAIDSREITLGDLESYVKVLESSDFSTSNASKVVEALINNGGNTKAVILENHKPSRKIKDLGDVGFELLQSFGSLLGEKLVGSKPNKVKNNVKPQMAINSVANQAKRTSIPSEVGSIDTDSDSNPAISSDNIEESRKKHAMEMDYFTKINITREGDRIYSKGMHGSSKRFINGEEYSYQNNQLQYQDNYLNISNMGLHSKLESSQFSDNLIDPGDYSFKMRHRETKTSFVEERGFDESNGAYRSSHMSKSESELYRSQFREEGASKNESSHLTDQPFGEENEVASSSSSIIYDDAMFNKCLMEANDLLKQAKDLMKYRRDEEHVEVILCQSASLLAKATTMKPMSLLAVGQLGNTYLLHGELKLRISRELRRLLAGKEPGSVGKWFEMVEGLDDSITRRDKLTSILISVCEECEELLVMAGRRYRMALSIDRNDVRALYNWGLALSFRAQLIADVGPEAAFDADKVFLAAIDKFDAMMSKGNVYAPEALFRWAMTLQQRSRLRPNNSKEKAKLLLQAKRLYEDSLNMNSDNVKVREALMSCISEIQFGQY
ncbi:hypothetical protein IC582_017909 [Cucumis melo]|uniref:Uncharacterized protein LOC103484532 n=2 Tax=Cucumis melo TaxID=3656 RepID=A0A1S3B0I3_CUCME|nr:uncharacterized protein LOC103484532 [Cucumis melo]KAA0052697.1 Tetratricopeptide repeat-like superfamily protein, putative isoform 1 [Cucumis melo var. makuwa]TYK13127.1 Tetratricopeptide repeat-like superfamily protein, putative isoform 1 [Cucumis melo var. makuwa]